MKTIRFFRGPSEQIKKCYGRKLRGMGVPRGDDFPAKRVPKIPPKRLSRFFVFYNMKQLPGASKEVAPLQFPSWFLLPFLFSYLPYLNSNYSLILRFKNDCCNFPNEDPSVQKASLAFRIDRCTLSFVNRRSSLANRPSQKSCALF